MTGSYIYATNSTTNIMSVLTQASLDASTALAQQRFTMVQNLLQKQFADKAAAAQADSSKTTSAEQYLQVQISGVAQQKSIFSTLQTQYGGNLTIFGDLSSHLTALQNAAQSGDSAGFDAALQIVNVDVSALTIVKPNPAMQNDGVEALKTNGLAISSSSTYDLTTGAGQAAALADVGAAQQLISQITSQTVFNQSIAGSQLTALGSKYDSLNNTLQNDKFAAQVQSTTDILNMKNKLNTQLHLVELQFSNSQAAAKSLENQQSNLQAVLAPAAPGSILSIFT